MDGSHTLPQNDIIVEVAPGKRLRIDNPTTHASPRVARGGDLLLGRETYVGTELWIIFEDGFGIRKRHLKQAWDDTTVEASRWDGNEKAGELFEG